MPLSDSQYDEVFEHVARSSANTLETLWRRSGRRMPAGLAERFGRVMVEFVRSRQGEKPELGYHIGLTRILELVDAAEGKSPAGRDDAAFLDTFATMLRAEFDAYDDPDPGGINWVKPF